MILNLISGPRNVSTALMYSFAQRSDTSVLDEPFYAVYLSKTGIQHPGREDVLRALPHDEETVRARIASTPTGERPVVFVKNMAHHVEVLNDPQIADATNIFLIRDPARILASYTKVISNPVMRDIGIAYQYKLFCALRERGLAPIVLDSHELLHDSPAALENLCHHCSLPFEQRMAHWPPGPKPYDGIWAPHWYGNVHTTTGFNIAPALSRPLPGHLENLYAEAKSIYEKLRPFSLKA